MANAQAECSTKHHWHSVKLPISCGCTALVAMRQTTTYCELLSISTPTEAHQSGEKLFGKMRRNALLRMKSWSTDRIMRYSPHTLSWQGHGDKTRYKKYCCRTAERDPVRPEILIPPPAKPCTDHAAQLLARE